ncbi:MAG: helix-turn-helix transcriptional regulator [Clostridia bacterium]|nr:helix-turn-helix transcriptional regulator [Clostridia bacterium]
MLKDNIKTLRHAKGLSQEALALRLNVVRQTISKWEQGLSVPDAEMLLALSDALEAPVSVLLGETTSAAPTEELAALSERLESINLYLARKKQMRRRVVIGLLAAFCVVIILCFAVLLLLGSPYLTWDYHDPETAVVGVAFHAFEWLFVRIAPLMLAGAGIGIWLARKFL